MNVATAFARRFVAEQTGLTVLAFLALAVLGPGVLRLDAALVLPVVGRVVVVGALAAISVGVVTHSIVQRQRFVLRALALTSKAIEPTDLEELGRLPYVAATTRLVIATALGLTLSLDFARPEELGSEAARELSLLGIAIVMATSVPGFVLAQAGVGKLLELAPLEPVTELLATLQERGVPRKRDRQDLALSVVVPVALIGVSAVLASYAHLRSLTEQNRAETASALANGVIGAGDTRESLGQTAAIKVAAAHGYRVSLTDQVPVGWTSRTTGAEIEIAMAMPRGGATVAFRSDLGFGTTLPLALIALACLLVATVASTGLARWLSRDLSSGAERLRTLGTERVIRGPQEDEVPATFAVVGRLGEAALALAARFRVFAAAQERALESKESARRMRGLLFATVSHDLKTPLNAILGFADTIDRDGLAPAQRESLDLIANRGRELLALIETILDAARVEAGQLSLARRPIAVSKLLARTAAKARELALESGELLVEIGDDLPPLDVDADHLTRALAVVIAHALRAPTSDGSPARVTVRASRDGPGGRVRVDVDHGRTTLSAAELAGLFSQKGPSRAKGLTLGLSLARSILELHGGELSIQGTPDATPTVTAFVPIDRSVPLPPETVTR